MKLTLARRAVAEFLVLVAAVVGSGITGERLAAGNVAIALLAEHSRDRCTDGRGDFDILTAHEF